MSKIAILSDIHGNLPAFRAVLRGCADSGAERIVFAGDVVGYGARPAECLGLVRRHGGESVIGNHDQYAVTASRQRRLPRGSAWSDNPVLAGIAHAVRQLSADELGWLAGLGMTMELPGAVLAHASLHGPGEWNYLLDSAAAGPTLELLRESGPGLGFFGHTHRQDLFFDHHASVVPERVDGRRIRIPAGACCAVVVGSVGQPRGCVDTRAGWATWDPDERMVEFRRTVYPAMDAARDILDAGLPSMSALRLLDETRRGELMRSIRREARFPPGAGGSVRVA